MRAVGSMQKMTRAARSKARKAFGQFPCARIQTAQRSITCHREEALAGESEARLISAPPSTTTAATTTITAAVSASASTVASATAGMLSFRSGLVYVERATTNLRAIQGCDGFISIFIACHFHEAEAS
jgi:hypothetical protein